jgi:hypothetical protein
VALDEAIGVGIERPGERARLLRVPDFNRSPGRCGGIVAQGNVFSDERGIHLIDDAVEAHGAVFLDLALGLEEEDLVEVQGRVWEVHLIGAAGPALQRGLPLQGAVGGVVVLAFDPRPEAAVERFEAAGIFGGEAC